MIPGKIFTSFAKFHGIVSVNDFWFPRRLQELHQALSGLLRSFCFARIGLGPLSCQILYDDSVSMTVSRFTSFTKNFVICCYQVTKIFCSRHGCASVLSPCYLGSHADVAVSVLRSVNTVFARYHFSSRLRSSFTRRTCGCVPMSWNTFYPQDSP